MDAVTGSLVVTDVVLISALFVFFGSGTAMSAMTMMAGMMGTPLAVGWFY